MNLSTQTFAIPTQHTLRSVAAWSFIASLLINLFCNSFSPFFIPEGAMDPNCFYAEACAITQGYLPYRDFLDVKGPLLLLIYTIGYILTPTHCLGIFSLYVLATWGTLIAFFRTAELFSLSSRAATLATALTVCCLFSRLTAYWAAQPEQLLVLPFSWTLYYFTAFLKYPNANFHRHLGWCLGCGATCTFLIKYNFVLPYAVIFILTVLLFITQRRMTEILPFFGRCLACAILICIPFILYISYYGLWNDFFHSYVTLNVEANANRPQTGLRIKIKNSAAILSYLIIAHALVSAFRNHSIHLTKVQMRYLLVAVIATFLSCFIGIYGYYYIFMAPTAIFLCAEIAGSKPAAALTQHYFPLKTAVLALVFIFGINAYCIGPLGWGRPAAETAKIADIQEIIACVPTPKIIYCRNADILLGRKASSVPGTPAWMALPYVGQEIYDRRDKDISEKKADFVVTRDITFPETFELLKRAGYETIPEAKIPQVGVIKEVQIWALPQTWARCTTHKANNH